MKMQLNFIRSVFLKVKISIICHDNAKAEYLKNLGAQQERVTKEQWFLPYDGEQDLADKLVKLRDAGFMFAAGRDWSPEEIFIDFRDRGMVQGKFICIGWGGPQKYEIFEE